MGILRGESIFSAELSDCFSISYQGRKDPHKWDALVMTILDGKTNRLNKLYGRTMRAKDVSLCPLGALGFYLLSRFQLTKEFDGANCPDFTKNEEWYDIKLLASMGGNEPGHTKEQRSETYYKCIREILRTKKITSNHYMHLGRVLGSANLQYKEIDDDLIRQLGNWSVTIRDLCYSTKLPIAAMRAAADFPDGFFCPRSQVIPPEELANKIFSFVEEQLARVNAAIDGHHNGCDRSGVYLGAAKCFLEMLVRLRTIILQDAAAMIALHPERQSHALFNSFPSIFRSAEFIVS